MALVEVPAARAHHQHRRLVAERIMLAGRRIVVGEVAAPIIVEIGLALDEIRPGRRGRVLEIGHERLRARIERVDHHLAVGRPGDLDPPVHEVGRDRRDRPVGGAELGGLGREIGQNAGVEFPLPLGPRGEQRLAAAVEPAVEPGDESQRFGAQDIVRSGHAARFSRPRAPRSPSFRGEAVAGAASHDGPSHRRCRRALEASPMQKSRSEMP